MRQEVSLGLDLNRHYIGMIKLINKGPGAYELVDLANIGLTAEQGPEEALDKLKQLVQDKQLLQQPVNIGVSGEAVIIRYIELPRMQESELTQALQYEAQQYIPFRLDEVVFDHYLLGSLSANPNKIRVLLVAAKKDVIHGLSGMIRKAGLVPNLIDVNAFALINCFIINGLKTAENDVYALVNIERDLVNISILQGRMPFFSRDISLSFNRDEELFKQEVLDASMREIMLSLDYFESEFERVVEAVYLSGEGASALKVVNFFREQLNKKIEIWNPLAKLTFDQETISSETLSAGASSLAIACGLALRGTK